MEYSKKYIRSHNTLWQRNRCIVASLQNRLVVRAEECMGNSLRPIPYAASLFSLLKDIIDSAINGKLAIVYPFGTIVTQNKLSLAFFHENLHLFTQETQEIILRFIPFTKRLSQIDPSLILENKDLWVLKSDYGCEGAEVIIGKLTPLDEWKRILHLANYPSAGS